MIPSSQSLLGGWKNNSIESLLEKHIKMMEPIARSDLAQQKMTNNSFQLPFLNIKIASKIAGLRTFVSDTPQPYRNLKEENTPNKKDEAFDSAYKCAMNSVGLTGDPLFDNWFWGAGYVMRQWAHISDTPNISLPLTPDDIAIARWCYTTRIAEGKRTAQQGFSTDLNEIQAFTQAINRIIVNILGGDIKLDFLPSK